MSDNKKRYYRKYPELHPLIDKIKLWPSRTGMLHGIRSVRLRGEYLELETHCGHHFRTHNSRKSRAARWLRNKWAVSPCEGCKVPEWKLLKYTNTFFSAHYGKNFVKRE
jgi:pyrrolysyl-tRNA synthetase-like protein